MSLIFNKSTDTEHEVQLEPILISTYWKSTNAPAGGTIKFEVITAFVGSGASIKVTGLTENGKSLGKISDVVRSGKYCGSFNVPEDIQIGDLCYFEVSFPGNGIEGESGRIPAVPHINVNTLKWSASKAKRGDTLTLSAFVTGVHDGEEVTVIIYEYDRDSAHDKITELPAIVEGGRFEIQWEFEYFEDTDELPTQEELDRYGGSYNPPEYFFTVKVGDTEFGKDEQASGLLEFMDWFEISLRKADGEPAKDEKYILQLPDGTTREGTLDSDGCAREEDIPPGKVNIEFPDIGDSDVS